LQKKYWSVVGERDIDSFFQKKLSSLVVFNASIYHQTWSVNSYFSWNFVGESEEYVINNGSNVPKS
jgi:hypothetical protein